MPLPPRCRTAGSATNSRSRKRSPAFARSLTFARTVTLSPARSAVRAIFPAAGVRVGLEREPPLVLLVVALLGRGDQVGHAPQFRRLVRPAEEFRQRLQDDELRVRRIGRGEQLLGQPGLVERDGGVLLALA